MDAALQRQHLHHEHDPGDRGITDRRHRHDEDRAAERAGGLDWAYRFFGAALLGRTPDDLPLGVRAVLGWAATEGRRWAAAGRVPVGSERTLGFRLAYTTLRTEAAAVRFDPQSTNGTRPGRRMPILAALPAARHRQRAALALRYGLRMDDAAIAKILGVRRAEVGRICDGATKAVVAAMRRPVDLPRALRSAARDPAASHRKAGDRIATVSALPRGVTRALLAPQPAATTPKPGMSPVEVLVSHAAVDTETRVIRERERLLADASRPATVRSRAWSLVWRVAAVAAVGMLFAWSVWPVHG